MVNNIFNFWKILRNISIKNIAFIVMIKPKILNILSFLLHLLDNYEIKCDLFGSLFLISVFISVFYSSNKTNRFTWILNMSSYSQLAKFIIESPNLLYSYKKKSYHRCKTASLRVGWTNHLQKKNKPQKQILCLRLWLYSCVDVSSVSHVISILAHKVLWILGHMHAVRLLAWSGLHYTQV